jgi:large subunit ribosomal protein L10
LDVAAVTKLRSELTESKIDFKVVKNTLLRRASADTDVALIADLFTGPTAIAVSYDDPVAPAKIISEFAKENTKLEIKGAVMEGKAIGPDGIKALSSLPPREVLLAQVLSTINGVPTNFVRVLAAVPTGLLNVLQAIKDQKEAA